MKLKIEMTMDNPAFDEGPEAGRILRELSDAVDDMQPGDSVSLRDLDGNTVGKATVSA